MERVPRWLDYTLDYDRVVELYEDYNLLHLGTVGNACYNYCVPTPSKFTPDICDCEEIHRLLRTADVVIVYGTLYKFYKLIPKKKQQR